MYAAVVSDPATGLQMKLSVKFFYKKHAPPTDRNKKMRSMLVLLFSAVSTMALWDEYSASEIENDFEETLVVESTEYADRKVIKNFVLKTGFNWRACVQTSGDKFSCPLQIPGNSYGIYGSSKVNVHYIECLDGFGASFVMIGLDANHRQVRSAVFKANNTGMIILIIVGVVTVLMMGICVWRCCCRSKKTPKDQNHQMRNPEVQDFQETATNNDGYDWSKHDWS